MIMSKNKENYCKIILSLFSMALMIYIGTTVLKKTRIDFTEEELYTISEGTKKILSRLDSPIKLKLYYSKTAANKGTEGLRAFNNHFLYVKELLGEYIAHSRNNLNLEVIDPRPDTPEEEKATIYGLKKFDLTETEKYFFGLVAVSSSGTERMIDFFDPNEKDRLEYELTKLIYTVLNPQKKKIGIISPLDTMIDDLNLYMAMRMRGMNVSETWNVIKMLGDFYSTEKIKLDAESVNGLDLLIIIHPKNFSEKMLFAIDQHVMKGGNLLVFVDPNAVSDRMSSAGGQRRSSSPDEGFKKLMDKWGIALQKDTYAGDKELSGVGRYSTNLPPARLLSLLICNDLCTDKYKDAITGGIDQSMFVFPGILSANPIKGITHTPILSTTEKGNSYSAQDYESQNPQILWNNFREGDKALVLGYKILGKFETAFPNGIKGQNNTIKTSQKESAIVIYSDVDFITDQFSFKQTFFGPAAANDNSTIFLNSVEAMTGDVELLSVRSKGRIKRDFDVINKIEFEAEKTTADKVKQINASIARFQRELNELGRKANDGNIALLQNEGLRKKKELAKKIALLKGELRDVKRAGREKIENIGKFFQYLNTLFIPAVIIVFGIYYSKKRHNLTKGKRKHAVSLLKEVQT